MAGITEISEWLFRFERSRCTVTFGKPLWAYKVTDEELKALGKLLRARFSTTQPEKVFDYYTNSLDKPLVLYLATWLQRNFHGGRSKWDEALGSIHVPYSQRIRKSLVEAVQSGLKKWGISVYSTESSSRYLDTLYCHGGFPRSDLMGESHTYLMDYFEKVLDRYSSFQHAEDLKKIAEQELETLPISLQQHPFAELAVALVDYLIELRDEYHLYDWDDPLSLLDSCHESWRDEIPFLVLDDEAQQLINKLLRRTSRMVRRAQTPVRVKRVLRAVSGGFQLVTQVHINHTIHPDDLTRSLHCEKLPAYFELFTVLNGERRTRTASFSYRSGQAPRWMVSFYETAFRGAEAKGEVGFRVFADGQMLTEGLYSGGLSLSDKIPWVFEVDGGNSENAFIGQGTVRSNMSSVFIVSEITPSGHAYSDVVEEMGELEGGVLKVFKVSGHVTVPTSVGNYHVRTQTEEIGDYVVSLLDEPFVQVQSSIPVYRGVPSVRVQDHDHDLGNPDVHLYWVDDKARNRVRLSNYQVVGTGSIVWEKDGEVLWHHRCLILPKSFDFELMHDEGNQFELKLINLGDAKIGMLPGQETWLLSPPEQIGEVHLCDIRVPDLITESVSIQVYWGKDRSNISVITFPVHLDSVTLTDLNGNPYRESQSGFLTIDDLFQIKIRVRTELPPENVRLKAELMNGDWSSTACSERLTLQGDDGLYTGDGRSIAALATKLMRHGTLPDNVVRMTFYANKHELQMQPLLIHRYKHDPVIIQHLNQIKVPFTAFRRSLEQSQLFLYLSPIWDLGSEPLKLSASLDSDVQKQVFVIPAIHDYGTWLLWAPFQASVQPKTLLFEVPLQERDSSSLSVLGRQLLKKINAAEGCHHQVYVEPLKAGSLEYVVKHLPFDSETGRFDFRMMDRVIREMGLNINHLGWCYVESVLKRMDDIEAGTFHVLKRMMNNPQTLVLMLLRKAEYSAIVWELADRLPFEWTTVPYHAWESAIRIYVQSEMERLAPLYEIHPEVFDDLIYQKLATLRNRGEYFQIIVDLALQRRELPSQIWLDKGNGDMSKDEPTLGEDFLRCRSELYERHNNKLMASIQLKRSDQELLDELETCWPVQRLPNSLRKFFRNRQIEDKRPDMTIRSSKITIELPIWVAFNNMGLFKKRLPPRIWGDLNFAMAELLQFDREWLNRVMALACLAAVVNRQLICRESTPDGLTTDNTIS